MSEFWINVHAGWQGLPFSMFRRHESRDDASRNQLALRDKRGNRLGILYRIHIRPKR